MRTRDEHMAWCKARALEYLDAAIPDPGQAVASMLSDLRKHPGTAGVAEGPLGMMGLLSATGVHEARRFIEGFN